MPDNTLKSGVCPNCGGNEVYTDRDKYRHNERGYLMVSPATGFTIDTYVCFSCGHFEEHFKESDFKDQKTRNKMKEKWKKI